ncbi:MAG: bifunctional phosphoribosylaminoimidazolecarboxamide formyltransferase/IMP cyclohydrolase [Candidatus Krumholzibacteria bacterium]|nr:bifunctional phosphoribosylaminoimidazolecarboxamide formyltransferase/IMP cyclohydrolase [Candidatus Krumholzibacteria bacterium]
MERRIGRALLSVTDKRGIIEFARGLERRGVEIVASGGTARVLSEAGVAVTPIERLTEFPECMDGRLKTLHPKVHGGILADRTKENHIRQAADLGIGLIDLVAVNLYRFREAASNPEIGEAEVVEQIDIGGPTLIRSAAKNHVSVTVIVDPGEYPAVLAEMDARGGSVSRDTKRRLASAAFRHTASYDAAISAWFDSIEDPGTLPQSLVSCYRRIRTLRYGENPHQRAALYVEDPPGGSFHLFEQIQGKELSFNNIQDMWAAFQLACDLGDRSCAVIKHMNPCGAAVCRTETESFLRARATDPVSAFGGVVAVNGAVDEGFADAVKEGFVEVMLARRFSAGAISALEVRKNMRLIAVPEKAWLPSQRGTSAREAGELLLVQDRDEGFPELESLSAATTRVPTPEEEAALRLAWRIVKHVRSNGIVICDGFGTLGVGAGQMSRVDSCRIAIDKAREAGMKLEGASAGSDAFFPFPDGVEALAEAGVGSIIQPGGSMRDRDVIAAAERLGIAMVVTGRRHFRH